MSVLRCILLGCLCIAVPVGRVVAAESASKPASAPESRPIIDLQALLADPPEVTATIESRRAAMQRLLSDAETDEARAQAHLALANWWLAVPTARPGTRWILGLDSPEDRALLARAGGSAAGHLIRVAHPDRYAASRPDDPPLDKGLKDRIATLGAFAKVFAACELPDDEAGREKWKAAALGLSEVRESSDADVSAAALVWQSLAWERAGRRQRALDALPEAQADPTRLPYDLAARWLRCQMMAEAGQPAAAAALAARIAHLSRTWLRKKPLGPRKAAQRTSALLTWCILRNWAAQPATATQPAAAEALQGAMDRLAPRFTKGELYVLDRAIPIREEAPAGPLTK